MATARTRKAKDAVAPTATFDTPAGGSYATGATATLTVVRPAGQLSAAVNIPGYPEIDVVAPVVLPVTVTAKDGRTYAKVSDDGTTAKYQTTA